MMEFRDLSAEIFSTAQQLQSKRLLLESSTLCGAPEGIRTPDPRIKSPLLYQLSYEHVELYSLYYLQHLNKPSRKSGKPKWDNKTKTPVQRDDATRTFSQRGIRKRFGEILYRFISYCMGAKVNTHH